MMVPGFYRDQIIKLLTPPDASMLLSGLKAMVRSPPLIKIEHISQLAMLRLEKNACLIANHTTYSLSWESSFTQS